MTEVAPAEFPAFAQGLIDMLVRSDRAGKVTLASLAPHLQQAININRAVPRAAGSALVTTSAIAGANGELACAGTAFDALLQREWPEWGGAVLPAALVAACGAGAPGVYQGKCIVVTASRSTGVLVLHGRPRSPLAHLSGREKQTAILFGAGKSTKEIARELDVTHNSVRNFVQRAYKKLGVSDKAALAVLIGTWPVAA